MNALHVLKNNFNAQILLNHHVKFKEHEIFFCFLNKFKVVVTFKYFMHFKRKILIYFLTIYILLK